MSDNELMKEPFDLKWFLLKMFSKWYVFILGTLAGMLLIGGSYYLVKVTFAPARDYMAETVFYMEYATDPSAEDPYTYFNEFTLNQWIFADFFKEAVEAEVGRSFTEEELKGLVTSYILADTRIQTLQVMTNDPALSMAITRAYAKAFPEWAQGQRELESIRVVDMPETAELIKMDVRTARAVLLGAVLGLFFTCMILFLFFLYDDRIEIPEQLEDCFHLTVLGTLEDKDLDANLVRLMEGKDRAVLLSVSPKISPKVEKQAGKIGRVSRKVEKHMKEAVVYILVVCAKTDTKRAVRKALHNYELQGIAVDAAVLADANHKMLSKYYGIPM